MILLLMRLLIYFRETSRTHSCNIDTKQDVFDKSFINLLLAPQAGEQELRCLVGLPVSSFLTRKRRDDT